MKKIAWYLYTALMVVSFFLYKDFKVLDIVDVVVSIGLVGVLILYVFNKRPFSTTNVWLRYNAYIQVPWIAVYTVYTFLTSSTVEKTVSGALSLTVSVVLVGYPMVFALYSYTFRHKTLATDDRGLGYIFYKLFKKPYPSLDSKHETKEDALAVPEGGRKLGGWLVLVGFGVIALFVRGVISLYGAVTPFITLSGEVFKTIPALKAALFFEAAGQAFVLGWAGYLLYLFFTRDKKFPSSFIYLYLGIIAFNLLDVLFLTRISYPTEEIRSIFYAQVPHVYMITIQTAVTVLIWGTYLTISKRSKETFVNTGKF